MSLRSSVANAGAAKPSSSSPPDDGGMVPLFQRRPDARLTSGPGQEKQKKLLAADAGHFSMIKSVANFPPLPLLHPFKLQTNKLIAANRNRALHLADLITELNGQYMMNFNPIHTLSLSLFLSFSLPCPAYRSLPPLFWVYQG